MVTVSYNFVPRNKRRFTQLIENNIYSSVNATVCICQDSTEAALSGFQLLCLAFKTACAIQIKGVTSR